VTRLRGVACLLMSKSGFFMGALSNGFKETTTKVIDYNADSQQGERRVPQLALLFLVLKARSLRIAVESQSART
jgi:hypothetical protein